MPNTEVLPASNWGIFATSKFRLMFFDFISEYSEAKPKYIARSSLKKLFFALGRALFQEYTAFLGFAKSVKNLIAEPARVSLLALFEEASSTPRVDCILSPTEFTIEFPTWKRREEINSFALSTFLYSPKETVLLVMFELASLFVILRAKSGVYLRDLVLKSKDLNLGGLEWAVGIPGTIGGAIFGNAGAHNHSIQEVVKEVEIFDGEKIRIFKNADCFFGYRDSIFKSNPNLIILGAKLELREEGNVEAVMKEYLVKRKVIKGFSIGSIFKNPEGYSAGKLIEDCGLKGKKVGDAVISNEHANWIINLGNASSKDVEELILIAKKEVKEKFNIDLIEEIRRCQN